MDSNTGPLVIIVIRNKSGEHYKIDVNKNMKLFNQFGELESEEWKATKEKFKKFKIWL